MNHSNVTYQLSYSDIDAILSRYYAFHGKKYKNQFATFCEENRCTRQFAELIISGVLAHFDYHVPFARRPADRHRARAALLRSLLTNPFLDFSKSQCRCNTRKLKIWICSECLSENCLLCSLECTTCFTPYEATKSNVTDLRKGDFMERMEVDLSVPTENVSSQIEIDLELTSMHEMYPFHRLDIDTMSVLVSGCFNEWEVWEFPQELISLVAECLLTFFEFESQTQNGHGSDMDVNDRTICRRDQFIAADTWRNYFGNILLGYNHFLRKFQWKLRCEGQGAAIIGFVEKDGASRWMGNHFAFYDDGYGVSVDAYGSNVTVELQWLKTGKGLKCEFLLNGEKAFELPPNKQYKLAVALGAKVQITCVEYEECE